MGQDLCVQTILVYLCESYKIMCAETKHQCTASKKKQNKGCINTLRSGNR